LIRLLLILLAFGLPVQLSAFAAEDAAPAEPPPQGETSPQEAPQEEDIPPPVLIEADQVESKGNDFEFIGNVIVKQGSTRIDCDRMEGKFEMVEQVDPETEEKVRRKQIVYLVASGNVLIADPETKRLAICDRARYDLKEDTIVLTGTEERRPSVTEAGITTEADEIVLPRGEGNILYKGRPLITVSGDALARARPRAEKKEDEEPK